MQNLTHLDQIDEILKVTGKSVNEYINGLPSPRNSNDIAEDLNARLSLEQLSTDIATFRREHNKGASPYLASEAVRN
jgi:hypothetical protein